MICKTSILIVTSGYHNTDFLELVKAKTQQLNDDYKNLSGV